MGLLQTLNRPLLVFSDFKIVKIETFMSVENETLRALQQLDRTLKSLSTIIGGGSGNVGGVAGSRKEQTQANVENNKRRQEKVNIPTFSKLTDSIKSFKTVLDNTEEFIRKDFLPIIRNTKAEITGLGNDAKTTKQRFGLLQTAIDNNADAFDRNVKQVDKSTQAITDFGEETETGKQKVEDFGKELAEASGALKTTKTDLDGAGEKIRATTRSFGGIGEAADSLKTTSYKTSTGLRLLSGTVGKTVGQLMSSSAALGQINIDGSAQALQQAIQGAAETISIKSSSTVNTVDLTNNINEVSSSIKIGLLQSVSDLITENAKVKAEAANFASSLANANTALVSFNGSGATSSAAMVAGIGSIITELTKPGGLQSQITRLRDGLSRINANIRSFNATPPPPPGGTRIPLGRGGLFGLIVTLVETVKNIRNLIKRRRNNKNNNPPGPPGSGNGRNRREPDKPSGFEAFAAGGFAGLIASGLTGIGKSFLNAISTLMSTVVTNIVQVNDDMFEVLAARGLGTTDSLLSLSWAAVSGGMSLRDMAKILDDSNGLLSRTDSMEGFNKRLAEGRDALAVLGVFGKDATRLTAAMASSAQTLGVPMSDLSKSTNGQVKVFQELQKTTTITAEAFGDIVRQLQSSEIVQKELLGLSRAERAARLTQLSQTAAWGRAIGLTADESNRLTQALLAQRRTTVKQRFQQRGRLTQAMGLVGMSSDQIGRAQQLASIRNRTAEEEKEYTRLLGEYAQRSEQIRQSGNPGMQYQVETMDEKLAEAGLGEMIDAAGRVRAAEESGPQRNRDLGKTLNAIEQALGKFITFLTGLSQSPLFLVGGAALAFVASLAYIKLQATWIGGSVAAALRGLGIGSNIPGPPGPPGPGGGGRLGRIGAAAGRLGVVGAAVGGAAVLGSAISTGLDAEKKLKEDSTNLEAKEELRDSHFRAGGVVLGTALGAVIGGPIGAAIGAGVGGVLGGFFSKWGKEARDLAAETQKNTRALIEQRRQRASPTAISANNLGGLTDKLIRDTRAYTAPTVDEVKAQRRSAMTEEQRKEEDREAELAKKNTREGRTARRKIEERERIIAETVNAETARPVGTVEAERPAQSGRGRRRRGAPAPATQASPADKTSTQSAAPAAVAATVGVNQEDEDLLKIERSSPAPEPTLNVPEQSLPATPKLDVPSIEIAEPVRTSVAATRLPARRNRAIENMMNSDGLTREQAEKREADLYADMMAATDRSGAAGSEAAQAVDGLIAGAEPKVYSNEAEYDTALREFVAKFNNEKNPNSNRKSMRMFDSPEDMAEFEARKPRLELSGVGGAKNIARPQSGLNLLGITSTGAIARLESSALKSIDLPGVNNQGEQSAAPPAPPPASTTAALDQNSVFGEILTELKRSNDYEQQNLEIQNELLRKTGTRTMTPNRYLNNAVRSMT